MEQNNRIVSFCFMETFSSNVKDERYIQFERRPLIAPYKLNCQAALWRRTSFIKYLKKMKIPGNGKRWGIGEHIDIQEIFLFSDSEWRLYFPVYI